MIYWTIFIHADWNYEKFSVVIMSQQVCELFVSFSVTLLYWFEILSTVLLDGFVERCFARNESLNLAQMINH